MKVAVTGASGFIGRHVIAELAARRSIDVVASSRGSGSSVSWPPTVRHVAIDMSAPVTGQEYELLGRPDVLVHLAWAGLPNYRSLHHFESELPRQFAFLRSLIRSGLPSLLVTGTCYEYGMQCGELNESILPQPANPYAHAKDALRQQLQFLRAGSGFALTWARLFYMYGPGQAATSLYPQLMTAIETRVPSFKMSGGEQLRDYLHIDDVARLLVELALGAGDGDGAGIVNVCSGRPVSVRTLVERWAAEMDSTIVLQLGQFAYPDYEPMAFWGSRTRIDEVLGAAGAAIGPGKVLP